MRLKIYLTEDEHGFCRSMYKKTKEDAKKRGISIPKNLATTCTKIGANKHYHVQGDNNFNFTVKAHCSWDAMTKAIKTASTRK